MKVFSKRMESTGGGRTERGALGAGRGAQGSLSSLQTRGHLSWGRQAQPGATPEGGGQCRVGLRARLGLGTQSLDVGL